MGVETSTDERFPKWPYAILALLAVWGGYQVTSGKGLLPWLLENAFPKCDGPDITACASGQPVEFVGFPEAKIDGFESLQDAPEKLRQVGEVGDRLPGLMNHLVGSFANPILADISRLGIDTDGERIGLAIGVIVTSLIAIALFTRRKHD